MGLAAAAAGLVLVSGRLTQILHQQRPALNGEGQTAFAAVSR
jgi:hypothetical protein